MLNQIIIPLDNKLSSSYKTLNKALVERQPSPYFSFMLFCYFFFTFKKSCFLAGIFAQASLKLKNRVFMQGISLKRDKWCSSKMYNEKFELSTEILAQARQLSLKRVWHKKFSLKLEKFPKKIKNILFYFCLKGNPQPIFLRIILQVIYFGMRTCPIMQIQQMKQDYRGRFW